MKKTHWILLILFIFCRPAAKYNNPTDGVIGFFLQFQSNLSSQVVPNGITVLNAPSSITENQSMNIEISFAKILLENTSINITSDSPSLTVGGSSTLTLDFTPNNSTVGQAVKLKAIDDENLVSETAKITISSPNYKSVVLEINIVDDDTQNFSVVGSSQINEGNSGSIDIILTKEPKSLLVVNLSSSDTRLLNLATTSLDFNPSNYSTPQRVSINTNTDSNRFSETISLTLTSSDIPTATWKIIIVESIRGTVSGLNGTLYLKNNGGEQISITNATSFVFPTPTISYNVSVDHLMTYQNLKKVVCGVTGEAGNTTIAEQNITIDCASVTGGNALGLIATDQTVSFATGDDGDQKRTFPKSYTNNGNGTTTDNTTGLTWQRCAKDFIGGFCLNSPFNSDRGKIIHTDAIIYCNSLNNTTTYPPSGFTNRNDWRLPSIQEISTLLKFRYGLTPSTPLIDIGFFPNPPVLYWTSTDYVFDNTKAWSVNFFSGNLAGPVEPLSKTNIINVRCVSSQ